MSEDNKVSALRSWEEIVNQRNPDDIDDVYTPDFVWRELEWRAQWVQRM